MSERKPVRSCTETGKPTGRTNGQRGVTRGGVAVRLGYGSPPMPDIAECIARPIPGCVSYDDERTGRDVSESQQNVPARGAAE